METDTSVEISNAMCPISKFDDASEIKLETVDASEKETEVVIKNLSMVSDTTMEINDQMFPISKLDDEIKLETVDAFEKVSKSIIENHKLETDASLGIGNEISSISKFDDAPEIKLETVDESEKETEMVIKNHSMETDTPMEINTEMCPISSFDNAPEIKLEIVDTSEKVIAPIVENLKMETDIPMEIGNEMCPISKLDEISEIKLETVDASEKDTEVKVENSSDPNSFTDCDSNNIIIESYDDDRIFDAEKWLSQLLPRIDENGTEIFDLQPEDKETDIREISCIESTLYRRWQRKAKGLDDKDEIRTKDNYKHQNGNFADAYTNGDDEDNDLLNENSIKFQILEAVRRRPALYDRNSKEYWQHRNSRGDIWKQIAVELNLSETKVNDVWRLLRQNYASCLQNGKINSILVKKMEFLRPYNKTDQIQSFGDMTDMDNSIRTQVTRAVKKYPEIYDTGDQFYHLRGMAWSKVAEDTKIPEETCRKVWRNIRKFYCSRVNRAKLKHDFVPKDFDKEIEFLLPFITTNTNTNRLDFKRNLLEVLKKFPHIYDSTNKSYRRPDSWKQIALDMNATEEVCRRAWRNIKSVYLKGINQRMQGNQNVEIELEEEMKYFHNYILGSSNKRKFDIESEYPAKVRLIEVIKKYPEIYDKNCQVNGKRLTCKDNIWEIVANEADLPASDCRTSWMYLKDKFARNVKRRNFGEIFPMWKFEDDMQFFLPFLEIKIDDIDNTRQVIREKPSDIFRKSLIKIMRDEYPRLYDVKHPEFSKKLKNREQDWIAISKQLNDTPDKCRRIWNELKATYVSIVQGRTRTVEKWKFYDDLDFLSQHIVLIKSNGQTDQDGKLVILEPEEDVFRRALIKVVEQYPQLYDRQHPDYTTKIDSRMSSWIEIGEILSQPPDRCRKAWNVLRNTFSGVLRQRRVGEHSNWKFQNEIEFMEPFCAENTYCEIESDVFRRKLLHTVKKYPFIYDYFYKGADRIHSVANDWNDVTKELQKPLKECRRVWRYLKIQFRATLDRGSNETSKYKYEADMDFMRPFMIPDSEIIEVYQMAYKLIATVKKYPMVYDASDKYYNKRQYVSKVIWPKIANEVEHSVEKCRHTWQRLKTVYNELIIEKKWGNNEGWKFYKEMAFMEKHIAAEKVELLYDDDDNEEDHDSETFTKLLIETLKKYPMIYDYTHKDYGKRHYISTVVWKAIANEVNQSVDKCKAIWFRLKHRLRQVLAREERKPLKVWKYYEEMESIMPFFIEDSKQNQQVSVTIEDEPAMLSLIKSVKRHPVLYDTSRSEYNRNEYRDTVTWERVANEVQIPVRDCRLLWRNLEQIYKSILFSQQPQQLKQWKYSGAMEFIRSSVLLHSRLVDLIENKYPLIVNLTDAELNTMDEAIWGEISNQVDSTAENCFRIWYSHKNSQSHISKPLKVNWVKTKFKPDKPKKPDKPQQAVEHPTLPQLQQSEIATSGTTPLPSLTLSQPLQELTPLPSLSMPAPLSSSQLTVSPQKKIKLEHEQRPTNDVDGKVSMSIKYEKMAQRLNKLPKSNRLQAQSQIFKLIKDKRKADLQNLS